MVARTAGPEWSGPVRGPDFFGPDFFGPVRGPDFSVRIFLVRSVVRIFRSGFSLVRSVSGFSVRIIRTGTDYPDRSVIGPDFFIFQKSGPDQTYKVFSRYGPDIGPDFLKNKIRTGPNLIFES